MTSASSASPRPPHRGLRCASAAALLLAALVLAFVALNRLWPSPWTAEQENTLRSLWLGNVSQAPADPSNRFADDPRAAELGAEIFRDKRFSRNGQVACSSCHRPELSFSDGARVSRGVGAGRRNTPSVVPAAHGHWYFWDGRRDSMWAQALSPLETESEHGGSRTTYARLMIHHYRQRYERIFGPLPELPRERVPDNASPVGGPAAREAWARLDSADQRAVDRVFVNIGKSLAAYQRQLRFQPSRFDRYVEQLSKGNRWLAARWLTPSELEGLELFIGRARCVTCHSGPLFTSFEFFSLALPLADGVAPDPGRSGAFDELATDPFTCLGNYSDAKPADCVELRFMSRSKLAFLANFKTPSLRNVAVTAPYMHSGQFARLEQVIDHYNRAPKVPFPEHTDIQPIGLNPTERAALVDFLGALTSPISDPLGEGRDG